ncbi:unnamed protein product [Rhizophagus irregularis]|nr:unnamed protein product [Rhizophagus irregularis]
MAWVRPLVVVERNMDSDKYDGASCHTLSYTVWWMSSHAVPILDWVAQSPDLNPIENLWNHLDRQVQKRRPLPKSKQELISAVQEEWGKLL